MIKDSSLVTKRKGELNRILRDVDRWISDTKMAVTGSKVHVNDEEDADMDQWAEELVLDRVCDGLLAKGGLLASRKSVTIIHTHGMAMSADETLFAVS